MLCKHIYQCAIHKTLNGVMEEWEIFQRTHTMLETIQHQRTELMINNFEHRYNKKRLDNLLYQLNMENIYPTI